MTKIFNRKRAKMSTHARILKLKVKKRPDQTRTRIKDKKYLYLIQD